MHLTFSLISITHTATVGSEWHYRFIYDEVLANTDIIDDKFFYSVPTSFFSLDSRIPKPLRELLVEAQGCLKSNYLTGASACARKLVYELAVKEGATGENYDDRIKSLKSVHPAIPPEFFDTLLTIQQVTSTKVHESSYDGWTAKHLRVILAALTEVLHEIYVAPAIRADRRKAILVLRDEVAPPAASAPDGSSEIEK